VKASKGVYNVIKNLSEGMSEIEASRFLLLDGEPLGAHPNVNFGMPNVGYGIASPTHQKKLALGENISIGCAYRRALCHRSIMYAENEGQLPEEYRGCMEYLFKPYFMSIVKWYEAVGIGAVCKDVYDAAMEPLGSYEKYGVTLNPGHFIHTDEWSNSPFYKDSETVLHSGMLIQCDYTAAYPDPKLCAHVEDGIAIADAALRAEIAKLTPDTYKRVAARRKFMINTLGIKIKDEIMPLSDIQAMLFVYAKDPSVVLAVEE
ncbi:MAG: hypothetical protein FWG71_08700, partial [Synergistaceae bacterium]|nr:hypothetical protein [Synergistaceae bacterium]